MYDIIVVGGGTAALAAALVARESAARVLVLEKSPRHMRGGNGRLTGGNVRFAFDDPSDLTRFLPNEDVRPWENLQIIPYPVSTFAKELEEISGGRADPDLIQWLARGSSAAARWLLERGVAWQLSTTFIKPVLGRTTYRDGIVLALKGGGTSLVEHLYAQAEKAGADIWYDAAARGLLHDHDGAVYGVEVQHKDQGTVRVQAPRVVLACGGFESSPAMRARYLGRAWQDVRVRAVPFNTGEMLEEALGLGAAMHGDWSACHACPVDPSCPPFGDEATGEGPLRLAFPYSITVNIEGRRFMDEGRDVASRTYASAGRAILEQPESRAFQIFDQSVTGLLDRYYHDGKPIVANDITQLARCTSIPSDALCETVRSFNASVCRTTPFAPATKDGRAAKTTPPKSNWANPLENPPFHAYEVVAGITFTYGGLRIDQTAAVLRSDGTHIPGLFAAGEITGGFFVDPYPAACGILRNILTGLAAGSR